MDRSARRALIAAALMFAIALITRAAHAGSENSHAIYNQWIADYAAKSLDGNILKITLIEEKTPAKSNPFLTRIRAFIPSPSSPMAKSGGSLSATSARKAVTATPFPPRR